MKYSTGNVSNKFFNLWLKMNKDVLEFFITIRRAKLAFPFLIYFPFVWIYMQKQIDKKIQNPQKSGKLYKLRIFILHLSWWGLFVLWLEWKK